MRQVRTAGWRLALLTTAAMAAVIALVFRFHPLPGAMVLGAVLALTLSRSRLLARWRGRAELALLLPLISLATLGVALLLKQVPVLGACAYVAAMFLSVWLRRFGPVGTRIGGLVALPFITLLIVPGGGAGTTPAGAALIALLALAVVVALRVVADATGFLPPRQDRVAGATAQKAPSTLRPIASTRMAIQLAVALAAAFALGALVFPGHVTWVVLTAYLVCSGNRGRADVLHKSGLRVLGAAGGTFLATAIPHPSLPGPALVVLLLAIVGIGLWLREVTYAAWALAMTLAITLLQGLVIPVAPDATAALLWQRLLAILVGACCGLAASWFVLPVRSEPVVRRRIADTLAALGEYLADTTPERGHAVDGALARLDEVAPPWRAWERLRPAQPSAARPGRWIALVDDCVKVARADPRAAQRARRSLGEARKALRDPPAIGPALAALREALVAGNPGPPRPSRRDQCDDT